MTLLSRALSAGDRRRRLPGWARAASAGPSAMIGGDGRGAPTQLSTALSIIRFTSSRLGGIPRMVVERGDHTHQPVADERFRLLWGSPERGAPAVPFWTTLFAHLEGWANAYMWRLGMPGRPTAGLELIHPSRVRVTRGDDGRPRYQLDGRPREHTRDDIVHICGLSWDGLRGVPPMTAARMAHATAQAQDSWQHQFAAGGTRLGGVVSTPAELDAEAVDEWYDRWDEQFSGPQGAGAVVLLQGQATFTPVSVPPSDAQLLQSRQYSREEILGCYGAGAIPHHMLGWKSNASNFGTGIESQGKHLIQHVFRPRQALVSDAISTALLPDSLELAWNLSEWLVGDARAEAEVASKMRHGGALTRDEWRSKAGLAPLAAPDDVWTPKNMDAIPAR